MGMYTTFINTHFQGSGCRLIARAYDKCRGRRVTLHAIPGYWDRVGVTDGTDSWIAPASAGLFFGTATGDCADLMRRLQAGEQLPPIPDWPAVEPSSAPKRQRIALDDEDLPVRSSSAPTTPRRTPRAALI